MSSTTGAHDPLELGGDLALDLVNTVVPGREGQVDLLATPDDLARWLELTGLTGPRHTSPSHERSLHDSPPVRRLLLGEALRLRATIVRLLDAVSRRKPIAEATRFALDRVMGQGRVSTRLVIDGGSARVVEIREALEPVGLLAPVAVAAARLAVDTDPARLRPCAAADCSRWFLDTSKGGRRRWCSMATCGNRAKAARFRRRHGAL